MSDLIRKSDVIKLINCFSFSLYKEQDDKIKKVLKEYIEKIPTAYSVDDVVKELEKIRAKKTCNKEKCDTKEICRICVVDDAIEIVKQGGVFDDVCEWKSASDGEFIQNPHTKRLYSNEPSMQNVYCNTCGKKIKVVN